MFLNSINKMKWVYFLVFCLLLGCVRPRSPVDTTPDHKGEHWEGVANVQENTCS